MSNGNYKSHGASLHTTNHDSSILEKSNVLAKFVR
jgi:hypothetical protein